MTEKIKALVAELKELQAEELYVVLTGSMGQRAEGSIANISPTGWVRTHNAEGNEEVIHLRYIKNVSY